jgi:hypothetical protein
MNATNSSLSNLKSSAGCESYNSDPAEPRNQPAGGVNRPEKKEETQNHTRGTPVISFV